MKVFVINEKVLNRNIIFVNKVRTQALFTNFFPLPQYNIQYKVKIAYKNSYNFCLYVEYSKIHKKNFFSTAKVDRSVRAETIMDSHQIRSLPSPW